MTKDDAEKLVGMLVCPIETDYPDAANAVQLRAHPNPQQRFRFYDEASINMYYAAPFALNVGGQLIPKHCLFTRENMLPQHIIPTTSSRLLVICMAALNEQRNDILGNNAEGIRSWFAKLSNARRTQAALDLAECKRLAALEDVNLPFANDPNNIAIAGINGIAVCREAITWGAIRELKALHIHVAAPDFMPPVVADVPVIPRVVDNNPLVPMSIEQIDTLIDFLKCVSHNGNKIFPSNILDVCQLQAHPHVNTEFKSNFYDHPNLQVYLMTNNNDDPISKVRLGTVAEKTVTPSRRAFAMGMVAGNGYINRIIQSLGVGAAEMQLRANLQGKALLITNWLSTNGVDRVEIKRLEVDILNCALLPADGGTGLPADQTRGFLGDAVTPATVARFKTLGVGLTANGNAINLVIQGVIQEAAQARLELIQNQANLNNRNNNANLHNFPFVVQQPAAWLPPRAVNPVNNPATSAAELVVIARRATSTAADLTAIIAHPNCNAACDTAVIAHANTWAANLVTIAARTVLATDLVLIMAHHNRNEAALRAVAANPQTNEATLNIVLAAGRQNDPLLIANRNTGSGALETIARSIARTQPELIQIINHPKTTQVVLAAILARQDIVGNVPANIQQAVDAKRAALGIVVQLPPAVVFNNVNNVNNAANGNNAVVVANAAAAIVVGGGQAAIAGLPPAAQVAAVVAARRGRF